MVLLEEFTSVTEKEVKRITEHSPNKSCELDPIPTWLLKLCLQELLQIITSIINLYLKTASVPAAFKSAHIHVRLLLKKANLEPNTLKNYRPVSTLLFISKILEKVVNSRIEDHLTLNNLHEERQSAYRQFHSTESALLKAQTDILQSLHQNDVTILVMLVLSAAFDTICHATLLHRLQHVFGITCKPLGWIPSYLSDCHQSVCINGAKSKQVERKLSLLQGSVLDPKFYTMYTKPAGSICRHYGLDHHFYTDDSHLHLSFKPMGIVTQAETLHHIESCLHDIVCWMHEIC
jgi:hypothetical protein